MNKLFFTLLSVLVLLLPISQQAQTPLDLTSGTNGSFSFEGMVRLGQLDGVFFYLSKRTVSPFIWEIWRSDGSSTGTYRLHNLGSGDSYPDYFRYAFGPNYFAFATFDDNSYNVELWKIEKGATSASKIKTLSTNGSANNLVQADDKLYYSVYVSGAFSLQRIDLKTAEVEELGKFGNFFARETAIAPYKTGIAFLAGPTTAFFNGGLYYWDSSTKKLSQIAPLSTVNFAYTKPEITVDGDNLFFFHRIAGAKYGLYFSNGTAAGTKKLIDLTEPEEIDNSLFRSRSIFLHKGKLYFASKLSTTFRRELYVSDGTVEGTKSLRLLAERPTDPRFFTLYKGELYFTGIWGVEAFGLAKINEQTGLPQTLIDGKTLGTGNSFGGFSLNVFQDSLVFNAFRDKFGNELWISNGTPQGTRCVDLVKGPGSSEAASFEVIDNKLFFTATTPATGYEIFVWEGKKTTGLHDLPAPLPLRVFPNPIQDQTLIEAPEGIGRWQLLDINGRVLERGIPESASLQVNIPTAHLPAGTYFLQAWSKAAGQMYRATLVKP